MLLGISRAENSDRDVRSCWIWVADNGRWWVVEVLTSHCLPTVHHGLVLLIEPAEKVCGRSRILGGANHRWSG